MSSKRPNILMVTIDSGRYDRLGVHGYPSATTPNLDALAAESVDYANANAPAGWTRPAMSAIFTGLFPYSFGFEDSLFPDEKHTLLAERLRRAGYDTILLSNNPYVSAASGLDRGFGTVHYLNRRNLFRAVRPAALARQLVPMARVRLNRRLTLKVTTDIVAREARRLIHRREPGGAPFFMYVHLEVHHPYLSDRRYLRRFLDPDIDEQTVRELEVIQRRDPAVTDVVRTDFTAEKRDRYVRTMRAMYDASYFKADEQVGWLLGALRSRNLWADTAAVITADHGECLGEHGMTGHGLFPYEQSMRVPLLIKYPQGVKPSGVDDGLVSTIDIGPTLCALAGADYPADQRLGMSLLDSERHKLVSWERHNFESGFEYFKERHPHVDWDRYHLGYVVGVKDGRHKFVWTSCGQRFLFDLQSDPREETDLAKSEPELLARFERRFAEWRKSLAVRSGSTEGLYEPGVLDHLRALGYLE